ncbi:MAG: hypothetical protein JW940_10040 [Polyangiaceae bacterium]|nr:hypothetical protein [Polyangiaceae bacterium]
MIDLDALAGILGLPEDCATPLAHRAAVALERRHDPGVRLTGMVNDAAIDEEIRWRRRTPSAAEYEDINRVTEEGAEAIGLALACSKSAWRIQRRLQARLAEGADWLMLDTSTGSTVVLEIGGTDEQDLEPLLARKMDQARRSPFSERGMPAACVVRFLEPSVKLQVAHGP